jgi:16S rRNA (uracil1498-N3)-methyltransferase
LTSNRFFVERIKTDFSLFIFRSGDEHHHLSRVIRVKPQEKVWLFDGSGTTYLARVEEIGPRKSRLFILKKETEQRAPLNIVLGQALLQAKKMDFIIQKSTEWGVSRVFPVMSERSLIKTHEKGSRKMERWQRIAREASKQSGQAFFPTIENTVSLSQFLKERKEKKKLLLSENQGRALRDILLQHQEQIPPSAVILVGPEGGWSEEEERIILTHGYEAVTLGKQILRAETAAISSVALISHFWNR